MGQLMNHLPPEADPLAALFREQRDAIPDNGFSLKVGRKVRREHQRQRLARSLPGIMLSFSSGIVFGFFVQMSELFTMLLHFFTRFDGALAPFGLQSWMVALCCAVLVFALVVNRREPQFALPA